MRIAVGDHVPDIAVEAYVPGESDPQIHNLADRTGGWTVLFFYPRDFTFVCPTELQAFAELAADFDAEDAELVAASTDSYWSHKAWYETDPMLTDVRYPVLADTAHRLGDAFGILADDGSALRATYVIDPDGVVRHASISDQSIGRSADEVLRTLQALRTGELCPVGWRPGRPTLQIAA
jgi:peroxiredoxin (alkyl hydroperoxide reductase subunit C)